MGNLKSRLRKSNGFRGVFTGFITGTVFFVIVTFFGLLAYVNSSDYFRTYTYVIALTPFAAICTVSSGFLIWSKFENLSGLSKGALSGVFTILFFAVIPGVVFSTLFLIEGIMNPINVIMEVSLGILYSIIVLGGLVFVLIYSTIGKIMDGYFEA